MSEGPMNQERVQLAFQLAAEIMRHPDGGEWAQFFCGLIKRSDYVFDDPPASAAQAREWLKTGRAFQKMQRGEC